MFMCSLPKIEVPNSGRVGIRVSSAVKFGACGDQGFISRFFEELNSSFFEETVDEVDDSIKFFLLQC